MLSIIFFVSSGLSSSHSRSLAVKVQQFSWERGGEYFEYFCMDLHLFHDSTLQAHLLRPFTFPNMKVEILNSATIRKCAPNFPVGNHPSKPRLHGDFLMWGQRFPAVADCLAFSVWFQVSWDLKCLIFISKIVKQQFKHA